MLYFALLTAACSTGGVLLAALISRAKERPENRLLALVVLCSLYNQAVSALYATGTSESYPYLIGTPLPISLLGSLALYLYVCALTTDNFRLRARHALHLLPPLVGLIWFVALQIERTSDPTFAPLGAWSLYTRQLVTFFFFGSYLIACFIKVERFHAGHLLSSSPSIKTKLHWLRMLLGLGVLMWSVRLVDLLAGPHYILWELLAPAATLVILLLAVFAIRHSTLITATP